MSRESHERMGTADLVAGAENRTEDWGRAEPQHRPMPDGHGMDAAMRDEGAMHEPRAEQRMPAAMPDAQSMDKGDTHMEQLAALFPPQVATDFRQRWDAVQIGFVDDPQQAVRQADELVAEVMKRLAANFAEQRTQLEAGLHGDGQQPGHTEQLRMALRSYRSFFQRLLSL